MKSAYNFVGGTTSQPDSTNNSPTKNATIPGTNQPLPPIIAALLELQNCPYNRIIIMTLSCVLQTIVLQECVLKFFFKMKLIRLSQFYHLPIDIFKHHIKLKNKNRLNNINNTHTLYIVSYSISMEHGT